MCNLKRDVILFTAQDIHNVIDMRIFGIEHHDEFKALVMRINNQLNPVLRVYTYQNWVCLIKFGNMPGFKIIR